MSTTATSASTTTTSACPLCGSALPPGNGPCPHCHASAQWRDYARAIDFAQAEFKHWREHNIIADANHDSIHRRLLSLRQSIAASVRSNQPFPAEVGLAPPTSCWRCGRPVGSYYSYCNTCGAPLGQQADTLRYLDFLTREIARASACELSLAQAHACSAYAAGRAAALRAELERGRLNSDQLAAERINYLRDLKSHSPRVESPEPIPEPSHPPEFHSPQPLPQTSPRAPRRSILEILLDPRSIQWLLASGGVLLVVGGVIWLASLGFFKNAFVVAAAMGAGTLLLLAGGAAIIRLTRYQLAGRALALLACLVMPLNLWFYNAHDLITLNGHLWLAALVCCVLYAIAAVILEDPVFVYVTSAGIAITGLLVLADLHKLLEIASPVMLLVSLGLVALHAERAFANNDGPFSRKRFGLACFWSAQALLAAGFLFLLGAQLAAWLPVPTSWISDRSQITTDPTQQILALLLVIAGAYAYLYSDLVVRRVGVYIYLAAINLLWAELLLIDLFHLSAHPAALIGAMALTSLVVNIIQAIALKRADIARFAKLTRPLPAFGMLLAGLPAIFGIILHFRATRLDLYHVWPYTITWSYVAAMVLTGISCRISGYLYERKLPRLASAYLAATAASTLVALAGFLTLTGLKAWPVQSAILMLIPIAYLLVSRLYKTQPGQHPLFAVAHLATIVLIFSVLFSALNIAQRIEPVVGVQTNVLLALFCAEAAAFYGLSALFTGGARDVYFSTAMACAAVWQILNYFNLPTEYYCITFAVLGTALLIVYRLAALERVARPGLVVASFRCANALMSLSFASAALMTLTRLATDETAWSLAGLLASFTLLGLVASAVVRHPSFRRFYIVLAIIEAGLAFVVAEKQIHLTPWQHIEMFCVAVGLILLTIGYTAWYREQDRQSDAATFCLFLGAILAGLPLAIAVLINRFWYDISLHDELALATIATAMFVTGFMCRLRSTTLIGGALLTMHLAMLLVFAGMQAQLAVGAYLALGGAALFTVGILLSIHRDRLLALPQKIKHHEGVFSVLAWR